MLGKVLDRPAPFLQIGPQALPEAPLSHLVQFLYPLPAARRTAGSVLKWWEERRGAYNLIVGAAGCATIAVTTLTGALPAPLGGGAPPLRLLLGGAVVYGVLANLCYCLGPLTELALYRLWGDDAPRAGPVLFRQGLAFSVGLTLFPIALDGLGVAVRLLARLLG